MSKIYENIVKARDGRREVRVWFSRELEGPSCVDDEELLWTYVHTHRRDDITHIEYADQLAKDLPRVNAVEVSAGDGGSLVYPDWP